MEQTNNFLIFFSYIGFGFQGSAYQKDNDNTVENKIIDKLYELQLIPNKNINFSRVSRTDKGVSARLNAISIRLKILYSTPIINVQKRYVHELNKKLKNIKVLHVQKVPNSFDARLNCIHRTYIYFFINKNYDIKKMKDVANLFIGEHNFSNFCKKIKNLKSFKRSILKFTIEQIDKNFFFFKIKGVSFLYNQIRHIVSLLFLIGKGEIDKNDIINMLNLSTTKKINYKIADEHGLLLYSFKFNDFDYKIKMDNTIFRNLMSQYIQSTMVLITLCYPLKIKNLKEGFFENLNDSTE